ncbi:RICIN domain-containing protein [Streptomyces chromofuscus]|uniref:RICIN domain-containing protein n=1 Tax=Streptomyces chromofuscus TaxID=42881 RepID=UPI001D15C8E8|nr:RICIN domain-containing protein [Streptomyces chromofuscus]
MSCGRPEPISTAHLVAAHARVRGLAVTCLDVTDNSSANGARARIWSCTGGVNQTWRLP